MTQHFSFHIAIIGLSLETNNDTTN